MPEIADHVRVTITDENQPFPMIAALLRKLGGVAQISESDLADVDGMVFDVTLYEDPALPMVLRLETAAPVEALNQFLSPLFPKASE